MIKEHDFFDVNLFDNYLVNVVYMTIVPIANISPTSSYIYVYMYII